jgi:serine/threonine-protein kinase PknG
VFERNGGMSMTRPSTRRRAGSQSVSLAVLGCNLVEVAPQAPVDPLLNLKSREEVSVPLSERYCTNDACLGNPDTPLDPQRPDPDPTTGERYHMPVQLQEDRGFCEWCGTAYRFVPELQPGDVVDRQYEIKGYLARGGFGIIYVAWDQRVGRYVVLKGVANLSDPVAMRAAVEEKRHLAGLDHPNIVKIYNFVEHNGVSYLVMQYIGGRTLRSLRRERFEAGLGPLPVPLALAYIHRILNAFQYLHQRGLVYRDCKIDNIMAMGDDVILIDLGAVISRQRQDGDIIFTPGYNPVETVPVDLATGHSCFNEQAGFSELSDYHTIMRTLAVLTVDFKYQQEPFLYELPTPEEEPLFQQYPSFYRLLLKGTRRHPAERFQSIQEMADHMVGVMREIVCLERQQPMQVDSPWFHVETFRGVAALSYRTLPALKMDMRDKAAGLLTALTEPDPERHLDLLRSVLIQYPQSAEVTLRMARLLIDLRQYPEAEQYLSKVARADPFDWRVLWYLMLMHMARGDFKAARELAETIYGDIPGELMPKLALAYAAELDGDRASAMTLYNLVSLCDTTAPSAAFGLARLLEVARDREGAVVAYQRVPASSIAYTAAQMALARTLARLDPTVEALCEAAQTLEALPNEGYEFFRAKADVLIAAAQRLERGAFAPDRQVLLLGTPLEVRALRLAAEQALRLAAAAVQARDPVQHYQLVLEANRQRPLTLV